MAIRTEMRRGQRRLVIDIRYTRADGSAARFRRDADVQTLAAARAEERRRLMLIGQHGSPWEPTDASTDAPPDPAPLPVPRAIVHQRRVPIPIPTPRPREQFVSLTARGKPWTSDSLGKTFTRDMVSAGLDGWSLHDLRYYFVTSLFRAGVSAPTVQALAGHGDLATTQRYAHVVAVDLQQAIGKLAAVQVGATRGQPMGNGAGSGSGPVEGELNIA